MPTAARKAPEGAKPPADRPETLAEALRKHYGNASATLYSQAKLALRGVLLAHCGPEMDLDTQVMYLIADDVGDRDVQQATSVWYHEGLSPATINKRLNCLSKMGVIVEGLRVKNPKKLKWHLPERRREDVLHWLRTREGSQWHILADFIEWTTRTGLRVEESLRLTWADVRPSEVSVPGLKTATSQATLPIGGEVSLMVQRWGKLGVMPHQRVFPTDYEELHTFWDLTRKHFGWQDDPTATLKALRRSAARYLHVDCGMPLHMVQQYLRHESMDTTLEYLRLTGGYGTEEMRRYLK